MQQLFQTSASAKHTHTGSVREMLMQISTLHPGSEANVTSLRRKEKAFNSFRQSVSDWLRVKVAAGWRSGIVAYGHRKAPQEETHKYTQA